MADLGCLLSELTDLSETGKVDKINGLTTGYIRKTNKLKVIGSAMKTNECLKHHDFFAVPLDKGAGFCLMKRKTYNDNLLSVSSCNQFENLGCKSENFVLSLGINFNKKLQKLMSQKLITTLFYQQTRSYVAQRVCRHFLTKYG